MALCPVCNKEFQNLKIHLAHQVKKDEEHKNYVQSLDIKPQIKFKTVQPGTILSGEKDKFVVVKDEGDKVLVHLDGKKFLKMKISKSEFNSCFI